MRLSQAIEACDPDLNATATSSLSESGLRRVLWCLTRQRPLVLISNLQVTLYNELFARLLVRHQQLVRRTVNSQGEHVDSLVGRQCKDLKNETELVDSLVQQLTDSWGFDQGWLDELNDTLKKNAEAKTKSRAKAIGGPAAAMPELLQPRPLMQAFAKAGSPARAGVLRPPTGVPAAPAAAAPPAVAPAAPPAAAPAPAPELLLRPSASAVTSVPPEVPSDPPAVPADDNAAVTADDSQHVESSHVENQSVTEPGEAGED